MAKIKSLYICQQCGYESPKWLGKCPACNEWNSFTEEVRESKKDTVTASRIINSTPKLIADIKSSERERYDTGIKELNRVLGGGLVMGSLTLISGDPGIGKSTLLLQCANNISQ